MTTLYNRLFRPAYLNEDTDQQAIEDTGLVSPYSTSRKDAVAIAIDNISKDSRTISNIIAKTHRKCSPAIELIKHTDLEGFMTFKSRVKETLEINGIFEKDSFIQDQIADLCTWAYAEASKHGQFLIFSDKNVSERIAKAIFNKLKLAGLSFSDDKISQLLLNTLITVLTKLDHGSKK